MKKDTKLTTGGAVLLKKHGNKYFSSLINLRWEKVRAEKERLAKKNGRKHPGKL